MSAAGREVPPLEVQGEDATRDRPAVRAAVAQPAGHVARARADVEDRMRAAPESLRPRREVSLEGARRRPSGD